MSDFAETISTAYPTTGAALDLGRGVHDGAVVHAAAVKVPLRMVNRHGQQEAAGAAGGGVAAIGEFLASKQGKAMQRDVARGVFGLLKKAV